MLAALLLILLPGDTRAEIVIDFEEAPTGLDVEEYNWGEFLLYGHFHITDDMDHGKCMVFGCPGFYYPCNSYLRIDEGTGWPFPFRMISMKIGYRSDMYSGSFMFTVTGKDFYGDPISQQFEIQPGTMTLCTFNSAFTEVASVYWSHDKVEDEFQWDIQSMLFDDITVETESDLGGTRLAWYHDDGINPLPPDYDICPQGEVLDLDGSGISSYCDPWCFNEPFPECLSQHLFNPLDHFSCGSCDVCLAWEPSMGSSPPELLSPREIIFLDSTPYETVTLDDLLGRSFGSLEPDMDHDDTAILRSDGEEFYKLGNVSVDGDYVYFDYELLARPLIIVDSDNRHIQRRGVYGLGE